MIAAPFGQLFIPIKRDKWLTGCIPILYGAKCSAEFLKRTRQGIFACYTSARNAKMTAAKVGNAQAHNERQKESYVNDEAPGGRKGKQRPPGQAPGLQRHH